jgi:hypothetical protein
LNGSSSTGGVGGVGWSVFGSEVATGSKSTQQAVNEIATTASIIINQLNLFIVVLSI